MCENVFKKVIDSFSVESINLNSKLMSVNQSDRDVATC